MATAQTRTEWLIQRISTCHTAKRMGRFNRWDTPWLNTKLLSGIAHYRLDSPVWHLGQLVLEYQSGPYRQIRLLICHRLDLSNTLGGTADRHVGTSSRHRKQWARYAGAHHRRCAQFVPDRYYRRQPWA